MKHVWTTKALFKTHHKEEKKNDIKFEINLVRKSENEKNAHHIERKK